MAWKTAGYYRLDRFLLPILGTAWQPIPIKQSRKDAGKVTDLRRQPETTRDPSAAERR